ncbi:hypothetical protein ACPA9J_27850 [Pseudomonas aeruginosa]
MRVASGGGSASRCMGTRRTLAVLLDEYRVGLDPPHLRRTCQDLALAIGLGRRAVHREDGGSPRDHR